MGRLLAKLLFIACILAMHAPPSMAASFDCGKARRPLEKFICATPELDAADTRLGEVYRRVGASFPLKGFVLTTQREFLAFYPDCMNGTDNRPSTGPAAAKRCVEMVRRRIAELETYERAIVYASVAGKFTHEDLAILVYGPEGRRRVWMWGNWMHDAFDPQPFPAGRVCDIHDDLKPVRGGGFTIDGFDGAVIRFTEAEARITGHIMCSARTGIGEGIYARVR